MLMSARDEDTGEGMTDEQLRVEVLTFLLAGQETTSLALTWTWYLLGQHPAVRQKLEDEIDSVLGGRAPEYSDLAKLPYLRMVLDESMRLYPPAPVVMRQATEAMRQWEREHGRAPTPILALTANVFREDLEKALAAGCTAHLTKPLKKQVLLNAIESHTTPAEPGSPVAA